MSQNLKSVQEYFDEAGPTDVTALFADWKALIDRMAAKVADRFELERDPSTEALEASPPRTGPSGSVRGYAGPEVDWMIHSHMENAALGFVNVHLTIWLGPQIRVPHFGMALGAFPQGWLFLDSVPRTNLLTDTDSFDRYYAPLNEEWEQVQAENDFIEPFVSRSAFVRAEPVADRVLLHGPRRPAHHRPGHRAWPSATSTAGWAGSTSAERVPVEEQAALAAQRRADPPQHRRARPRQRDG